MFTYLPLYKTGQDIPHISIWISIPSRLSTFYHCRKWTNIMLSSCVCSDVSAVELVLQTSWYTIHSCGRSTVCTKVWFFKSVGHTNAFEQTVHSWGLCPVCRRACFCRCAAHQKLLPQSLHRCERSIVCTRAWVLRLLNCVKHFPHSLHTCGRSPVCVWQCIRRLKLSPKPLLHTLQIYRPSLDLL